MKYYQFKNPQNKDRIPIGKIVCLARTYKKHANEMKSKVTKEPLLFLKPSSSVIFNHDSIIYPTQSNCLHHEVELGVVIGKKCRNISREEAFDYILGYCLCLDITARDIQDKAKKNGWPWSIAKGFDTFAPISQVVTKDEIKDPHNLNLILKINGETRQMSNTKNMIFSIPQIIEFISKIMTLETGDLIMTGTPEGVGKLKENDIIDANLGDICFLHVNVKNQ